MQHIVARVIHCTYVITVSESIVMDLLYCQYHLSLLFLMCTVIRTYDFLDHPIVLLMEIIGIMCMKQIQASCNSF